MEIRSGYGANGARVSGPVRVGDPLTLLIYMRSAYGMYSISLPNRNTIIRFLNFSIVFYHDVGMIRCANVIKGTLHSQYNAAYNNI